MIHRVGRTARAGRCVQVRQSLLGTLFAFTALVCAFEKSILLSLAFISASHDPQGWQISQRAGRCAAVCSCSFQKLCLFCYSIATLALLLLPLESNATLASEWRKCYD